MTLLSATLLAGAFWIGFYAVSDRIDPSAPYVTLADVEQRVDRMFPVKHLSSSELESIRGNRKVVLFDVREEEEFALSHIEGAIRIDPNEAPEKVIERFRNVIRDTDIVFYCSVGVRSSKLLREIERTIDPRSIKGAYNLRGGIFRWHTDGRPVVRGSSIVGHVHPFSEAWGALLQRTLKASSNRI